MGCAIAGLVDCVEANVILQQHRHHIDIDITYFGVQCVWVRRGGLCIVLVTDVCVEDRVPSLLINCKDIFRFAIRN